MEELIDDILKIDKDRIFREDFHDDAFEEEYFILTKSLRILKRNLKYTDNNTRDTIKRALEAARNKLNSLVDLPTQDYFTKITTLSKQIITDISVVKSHLFNVIKYEIIFNEILNVDSSQYKSQMDAYADKQMKELDEIKKKSDHILKKANDSLNIISNSAAGIASKMAQDNFESASNDSHKKYKEWGLMSIVVMVCFIITWIYYHANPTKDMYITSLRVMSIVFELSLLSYGLRVLKMHMRSREHNKHRMYLAKSIGSLTESAAHDGDKAAIAKILTQSISEFDIGKEDKSTKLSLTNLIEKINKE